MLLLLFTVFVSDVGTLQCYEGSKGLVNGQEQSNFRETTCDDNMKHCFLSYSDDWSDVTAACQTLSTDDRLLSVCETGCVYHNDINVTVCCCSKDLCNPPVRPTPPSPTVLFTTILPQTTTNGSSDNKP